MDSKDSHEYGSMLTSPTNIVASPFESFQMTFHVGKILGYRNPSLISLRSIVDVFPGDQQEQARLQVSTSLLGIMSQTLCKNNSGKRSLAYELLVNTPAIANLIRERKVSQIYSQLQTGSKEGMNTLEQCLLGLVNSGAITRQEAMGKASNPKALLAEAS